MENKFDYSWKSLKEAMPTQASVLFAVKALEPAPLFGDEGNMDAYTKYVNATRIEDEYYSVEKLVLLSEEDYFGGEWIGDPFYMVNMSNVLAWIPMPFLTKAQEARFWEEMD